MTAACARVGANAPNGSDAGSLAAEMRGGSVELVKKSSWQACGSVACIADFAATIQLASRPSEPSERAGTHTSGPFRLRCGQRLLLSTGVLARTTNHAGFLEVALRWRG